ncbi:hypothetical protein ACOZ4L_07655 [Haloplanus ruber]|uniref:Sulfite exporter TauE/SafE family protein n=1 Tax=Haloplanus ruber TaxID=869892 RepID=A0ABD6CX57_9EURY|nr:hypothetical protein [Haloplanus ruber]
MAESNTIPFWWVLLFLLLSLGIGALAVSSIGGSLIAGVVLPV